MAWTITALSEAGDGDNVNPNPHVSDSISPSGDSLIVVFCGRRSGGASARNVTSVTSGFSVTAAGWTEAAADATQGNMNCACWYAITTSSPGSGTISVTYSGGGTGPMMHIIEVQGFDATTPITQTKTGSTTGTSLTVTLDSTPDSAAAVIGAIAVEFDNAITPGGAFTELFDTTPFGNQCNLQSQYDDTTPGTGCDWSDLQAGNSAAFVIEIAASGGGPTPSDPVTLAALGVG